MKRQFLLVIAITVFASAFATNASAQSVKTVRVNVMFDFQIGDHTYPAGEYRIQSIGNQPDNILQIRSVSGANESQFIATSHSRTALPRVPKLVFEKYGENYFLTDIVLESGQWGYSIRASRPQRESERQLAARTTRN